MKTFAKITLGALALAVVAALAVAAFIPAGLVSAASETRGGPGGTNGRGQSVNAPVTGTAAGPAAGSLQIISTPLSAAEQSALQDAILEEYGALNLYNAVIAEFGSTVPFDRIARSESQHVATLINMAEKYGVDVPENPGLTAALDFATLAEACQAGVDAEITDAALYDELELVTTHSDLLQVYNRLQSASLNSHLPAFEICAP